MALADGRIGNSGAPLLSHPSTHRRVIVGNVYVGEGPDTRLLTAPSGACVAGELAAGDRVRRVLDLRTGVLHESDGSAHVYGVIGPDEYHESVDDNALTNVMARWNLRRAAAAIDASGDLDGGVPAGEVDRWRALADAVVDGWDPHTGVYEQFAGFRNSSPSSSPRWRPAGRLPPTGSSAPNGSAAPRCSSRPTCWCFITSCPTR